MEIAAAYQRTEVLKMLEEVTEITDKVKIIQMSVLMKSDKPKRSRKEFQSLLETLPVDLVRNFFSENTQNVFPHKVSTMQHGHGTLLHNAVYEGKTDYARLLLQFG